MSLGALKVRARRKLAPNRDVLRALEGFVYWVASRMREGDRPRLGKHARVSVNFGTRVPERLLGQASYRRRRGDYEHTVHIMPWALCSPPASWVSVIVHELRHVRDHQEYVREVLGYHLGVQPTVAQRRKRWHYWHAGQNAERRSYNAERNFAVDVRTSEIVEALLLNFAPVVAPVDGALERITALLCPDAHEIEAKAHWNFLSFEQRSNIPAPRRKAGSIPPPRTVGVVLDGSTFTRATPERLESLRKEWGTIEVMPTQSKRDQWGRIFRRIMWPGYEGRRRGDNYVGIFPIPEWEYDSHFSPGGSGYKNPGDDV